MLKRAAVSKQYMPELIGAEGFLFNDGEDVEVFGIGTKDAAIAGGVVGDGGEDGHGGVLTEMDVVDGGEGLGTDEGDVAGENEQVLWRLVAGEREPCFDHLQSVSGAALLGLQDELDAGVFDGGLYAVGLMADDAVDLVGWNESSGGGDDVEKEGAASDLVKNFGALAFEPRAFACGHDGDCESCSIHYA